MLRDGNTNTLYDAGLRPNVIVRSGRAGNGQAPLAYSEDGGNSWQPLALPIGATGNPALITSADGKTFMVMTAVPQIATDQGKTWTPVAGLPETARPIAEGVNPAKFYALDFKNNKLFTSTDGGKTFAETATTGLPKDISEDQPTWSEAAWPLYATNDKEAGLYLVSKQGLFHSVDGGRTFAESATDLRVEALSFGKAPQGKSHPALFAIGRRNNTRAIWRSDDEGTTWIRLNDERHQWGTRFRCIAADPRIFGRVYIGTDGRGILYGEPTL